METMKVKITGKRPLLMHSDKLADPLNPLTKEHKALTGKRKKTDDDHEAIAKSSWAASLYIDEDGPYIPGVMLESCMVNGGKLSKLGAQLKRSAEVLDEKCPLKYKGPKTMEELWKAGFYDARSVKVSTSRVMRYRPIFREWEIEATIAYDQESIDKSDVKRSLEDAGAFVGIGDYRPKFGRFNVEVK